MRKLLKKREELMNNRKSRGFTIIEIILVVAIGLTLIVGSIAFFQQAQSSSEISEKTRIAVGVSSEVRAQARSLASFDAITSAAGTKNSVSYPAVTSGPGDKTPAIIMNSAIPASQFVNMTIMAAAQEFTLTFSNLNETVCRRLATTDLGPGSTTDTANCATGTLAVEYVR